MGARTVDAVMLFGADPVYRVEHDGTAYLTDRAVMIREDAVTRLGSVQEALGALPVTEAANGFLGAEIRPEQPVGRFFARRYVDPLWAAGCRIVPTSHIQGHRILAADGTPIGWIMPSSGPAPDDDRWVFCGPMPKVAVGDRVRVVGRYRWHNREVHGVEGTVVAVHGGGHRRLVEVSTTAFGAPIPLYPYEVQRI